MFAQVSTVTFEGIDAKQVDVQVLIAPGLPAFSIVGLPDKSVGESRERVRAALTAIGLGLPAKRITVNLAPADTPKEGTHYDLPIALGVMAAAGAIPAEVAEELHHHRRTWARWRAWSHRGRIAGGARRRRARQGLDLPSRLRPRGGVGLRRHDDCRASPPSCACQPHQGNGAPAAAPAASRSERRVRPRPQGRARPGKRKARARSRGRRRPPHADDRPARRRQVHACPASSEHPAAAGAPESFSKSR